MLRGGEQPAPAVLRSDGQKQSNGLFLGRGSATPWPQRKCTFLRCARVCIFIYMLGHVGSSLAGTLLKSHHLPPASARRAFCFYRMYGYKYPALYWLGNGRACWPLCAHPRPRQSAGWPLCALTGSPI